MPVLTGSIILLVVAGALAVVMIVERADWYHIAMELLLVALAIAMLYSIR